MSTLLDDLLALPVGPQMPVRSKGDGECTRSLELTPTGLTATLTGAPGEATEGTARQYLIDEGQDPDAWEVVSMRKSTWDSPKGEKLESCRFGYKRKDVDGVRLSAIDIDMLERLLDGNEARNNSGGASSDAFVVAVGDLQVGKALADDTPVLTTDGWVDHGDIRPGMFVYGADGRPKRVTGVTGSTFQELYDVEFGDGSHIIATADHLWSGTRDMHPKGCKAGDNPAWECREVTVSTAEVAKMIDQSAYVGRPFQVLPSAPIEFPEAELPIDPYILGLWLGDGSSRRGIIAKGYVDEEHLTRFGRKIVPNGHCLTVTVDGLAAKLGENNLKGDKHIPEKYIYSSIDQRIGLVRGLMDADGTCDEKGACEFSNTNKNIIDGMVAILHSLGIEPIVRSGIGKIDGVEKKPYWRVGFRSSIPAFLLERKASGQRMASERQGIRRTIRSVTKVDSGMAQCITVDGGLYLAGKQLVVTHNCDGDASTGIVQRAFSCLDNAASILREADEGGVERAHIAFLGDHIEGFESQGGNNAWRTTLTLTEQLRVVRAIMTYAVRIFAPLCSHLTVVAVPGNHGEAKRFGSGITRYDDSFDTDCLIAVAEACKMAGDAYSHVKFYTPDRDELIVTLDVGDTRIAHAHGHKWKINKHFDWWKGQAFNRDSAMHTADVLLAGHTHHFHAEMDGTRLFLSVPALESESTWFRHQTGTQGAPGIVTAWARGGTLENITVIRGDIGD